MKHWMTAAGWAAALACSGAAVAAGINLQGYSHAGHPLALLGAGGIPGALAFNIAGFIVPGVLGAAAALGLYQALPATAGWLPRIGARMLLLSALAFAAQGLAPLDLGDIDGPGSGLHAGAWLAWWVAFVAGAPLLAGGLRHVRAITGAAVVLLVAMMLVPPSLLEQPVAQRIALGAWLVWLALAPWQAQRAARAPSTPAG